MLYLVITARPGAVQRAAKEAAPLLSSCQDIHGRWCQLRTFAKFN